MPLTGFLPIYPQNYSMYFNLIPHYSQYDLYCTNEKTVPGEQNLFIGTFYILHWLFYTVLYIPCLIVMKKPVLFKHPCYKLMFFIGVLDNMTLFTSALMAGYFSLIGANYCDNTFSMVLVGHLLHGSWAAYCMACVILALNRCIELRSYRAAEALFGKQKVWLWMIGPCAYASIIFLSPIDIPPVYNTVYSVFFFQIDLSPEAELVTDFSCVSNSAWVMTSLILLYIFLINEIRKRKKYMVSTVKMSTMQRKVMVQSTIICFLLFNVVASYAYAGFYELPKHLLKFATIAIQMCSGTTALVYLLLNRMIREEVRNMYERLKMQLGFESAQVLPVKSYSQTIRSSIKSDPLAKTTSNDMDSTMIESMKSELVKTPSIDLNSTFVQSISIDALVKNNNNDEDPTSVVL